MQTFILLENLFILQDLNKQLKLNATTSEQLKQVEKVESNIQKEFKKLYIK